MFLPSDTWSCIYRASTPKRRKAILALNKDISDAIRPSIIACVSADPDISLPSVTRFVRLSEVYTEITTAQAHDNWKFACFQSETQTVRLCFKSTQDYRQGLVTHIMGAAGIEVSISCSAMMPCAGKLLGRCSGIVSAKFVGRTYLEHAWPTQLESASLERLAFEDLLLPHLSMPSLLHLTSVTRWDLSIRPEFFENLPKLETLIITANRALTAIRLPPSITTFHIFLRRPGSELELCNISNLRELHLYNIRTDIQLPPFLTRLTLSNTRILNLFSMEIISHPPLRQLSFHTRLPTVADFLAWGDHQLRKGAQGWCRRDAISLEFRL